uniref:Uncharacterized protein n=1 Tax=Anguilla anguilla TaxID=7936 RepID=A0A0E9PCN5_ANGAN
MLLSNVGAVHVQFLEWPTVCCHSCVWGSSRRPRFSS